MTVWIENLLLAVTVHLTFASCGVDSDEHIVAFPIDVNVTLVFIVSDEFLLWLRETSEIILLVLHGVESFQFLLLSVVDSVGNVAISSFPSAQWAYFCTKSVINFYECIK